MYFIDLSMRRNSVGYRDSIALIADVIDAPELTDRLTEADAILSKAGEDIRLTGETDWDELDSLGWILIDAEDIAADNGFDAFAHDGYYYVMTHKEFDVWWAHHEV